MMETDRGKGGIISSLRIAFVVIVVLLSSIVFLSTTSLAQAPYHPDISHPSKIVSFQNFSTPQMEPGDSGDMEFRIVNRYDGNMTNVSVEVEIYRAANEDESKDVSNVKYPPTLNYKGTDDSMGDGTTKVVLDLRHIPPGEQSAEHLKFTVKSKEDTYEATYLVRTMISFDYEGHSNGTYVMKSFGHFTTEKIEEARTTNLETGNLDLGILEVSGITPDTSFGVRENFPQWPKWICLIPGAVIFLGLGILFVAMENYGKFPKLMAWLDNLGKKKKG